MGDEAVWSEAGVLSEEAWARATSVRWDPAPVPHLAVPVIDPDLGAIAVLRLPDGREVYGADSPPACPPTSAGTPLSP